MLVSSQNSFLTYDYLHTDDIELLIKEGKQKMEEHNELELSAINKDLSDILRQSQT